MKTKKTQVEEVMQQILENQCAMLLVYMTLCTDKKMRHHLGKMRRDSVKLLEKQVGNENKSSKCS